MSYRGVLLHYVVLYLSPFGDIYLEHSGFLIKRNQIASSFHLCSVVTVKAIRTLSCFKVFHAELERSVSTLESSDTKSRVHVIPDPNEKSWVLENKLADINERYNR